MSSDSQMIEVFATDRAAKQVAELKTAVGADFDDLVRVVTSKHSMDEFLAAADQITLDEDAHITGVGPDIINDGIVVRVLADEGGKVEKAILARDESALRELVPAVGPILEQAATQQLNVRFELGGGASPATES